MAAAFDVAWREAGGEVSGLVELDPEGAVPAAERVRVEQPDVLLLAVGTELATALRPLLESRVPAWGTSRLSLGGRTGVRLPQLDGVRVVETPDLLAERMPDGWPHANIAELRRLRAFGSDAWRVAQALLAGRRDFTLDGDSGRIRLDAGSPLVMRVPQLAQYRDGVPTALTAGELAQAGR